MPKTRRRTRRTDSNGALKEVYREPWDREQLENARRAGIPSKMLDVAGSDDWRDTGALLGLWAEWVYVLSDCLRGEDHLGHPRRDNLGIVEDVFAWMHKTAEALGVDPDRVIPWDVWYIRRDLSPMARTEDRTASEIETAEAAKTSHAEAYDAGMASWGCPSGPGHDSHGHGLSNGHWTCYPEENS